MISQLINRPCSITRRLSSTTTDGYGNEKPEEDVVETVCELQQMRRDEQDTLGETSDTYWNLYLLPGTAIRTADKVTVDGQDYEVMGDGWAARNPRTMVASHVEATLRKTAGSEEGS